MTEDHDEDRKGADPYTLVAHNTMVPLLTGSSSRNGMSGTADRMPRALREGSMDHLQHPSRMGSRLHFADGTTKEIS